MSAVFLQTLFFCRVTKQIEASWTISTVKSRSSNGRF